MNKDYLVVLDACVMAGGALRDTLLRLAETPRLFVPKWSDDIITETLRVLQTKLNKTSEQTQHLQNELRKAFPEAWVENYKILENQLTNHPKDRHVLAAAIRCSAQTIVTFNLKDFPANSLDPFDIEALDHFLVSQFHLDDALVTLKFTQQANKLNRTVEHQLQTFHKTGTLPLFTQTPADAFSMKL
ncbi:MAG: PIN domain-containing protein [Bryobacteraceae bacterium]